ncbi:MAG: hypothetical protein PF445_04275 [Melioribacteraceae bacterium]|nr:hypothetical protein [Melioribacteraceae bacterium]
MTIKTLINEYHHDGSYKVNFDASYLTSGVYFYKLEIHGSFVQRKKCF